MAMVLKHGFGDLTASRTWIQLEHRKSAIEYAVAGIGLVRDANARNIPGDTFWSSMEDTMRDWVVETLYQGAYMREYHIWEKDCRAYFPAVAQRNGQAIKIKGKGEPLPKMIRDLLPLFDATMPSSVLDIIEQMRVRVNVMKHEAGLEVEHFITSEQYGGAISAIDEFWRTLSEQEFYSP